MHGENVQTAQAWNRNRIHQGTSAHRYAKHSLSNPLSHITCHMFSGAGMNDWCGDAPLCVVPSHLPPNPSIQVVFSREAHLGRVPPKWVRGLCAQQHRRSCSRTVSTKWCQLLTLWCDVTGHDAKTWLKYAHTHTHTQGCVVLVYVGLGGVFHDIGNVL